MKNSGKHTFTYVTLMLAGEVVFLLPFVVTRIFRPTFLEVFQIDNFQLGSAFSVYGIVAMLSYFFGGPLADRYSPRLLLTISLLATGTVGFVMASIPSLLTLTILYGFWGMTTILLFWAAYTKATRILGGHSGQGRAYGLVDGGRGLVAAAIATTSVSLLAWWLPDEASSASTPELTKALSGVIRLFSLVTIGTAALVWMVIRSSKDNIHTARPTWEGVKTVIKLPSVWRQAVILLCAYVAYKCTDDISLYAYDVLSMDDVEAAGLAAVVFWVRPVAAVLAGLVGDRWSISNMISACFSLIIICSLLLALGILANSAILLVTIIIAVMCAGIFGLRALYYALFQESQLPLSLTGSAVGVISVVGFTPDVFFGPVIGYVLDNYPGATGHQYLFAILGGFAFLGLIMALMKIAPSNIDAYSSE